MVALRLAMCSCTSRRCGLAMVRRWGETGDGCQRLIGARNGDFGRGTDNRSGPFIDTQRDGGNRLFGARHEVGIGDACAWACSAW
jgi:hypothetical protein